MENLRYHTLDELQALSLSELHALWELVPTDRQRAYKAAYEREVRTAGAVGSDELERQVAAELLKRYADAALVPVGSRWARAPGRVQDAARQNIVLDAPENEVRPTSGKPSPKIALAVGLGALLFFGFMLIRVMGGRSSADTVATPEISPTPTPLVSPTPTPLALEAQDDVIQGGDSGREVAYPVNLQVILPDGSAPRLWVVQRRRVQASEWRFDPNPDTASFVSGMAVRPVIGIPWSPENAAVFDAIRPGATFLLTLNTGAVLRFDFAERREVRRSETASFRQVSPGLVLLLIGETDDDGLPTATRPLVIATYPPEQELGREGALTAALALPTPIPTPTQSAPTPLPFAGLDVQLIAVTTAAGQMTARLWLYNGGWQTLRFTPDDIWLALGYAEDPPGPRAPAERLTPFDLLPGQAADLTLVWAWSDEPYASLGMGVWRFAIALQ